MRTSSQLSVGEVYTRKELREMFAIKDANIDNGVFRPGGHESIWLFITKETPPGHVPRHNDLTGDKLEFDGQNAGRTDRWLIEHKQDDMEVILFYREHRDEYPGSGFRYEGLFEYVSHEGKRPTKFTFRRVHR